MTIDEIIARRAPERDAKVLARAQRRAALGDDELEADELETEMMEAVVGEGGADEEESESEESAEEDVGMEKGDGLEEDTEENWLRIGELSDGEEETVEEIAKPVEGDDEGRSHPRLP